jgi:hypothetical protein
MFDAMRGLAHRREAVLLETMYDGASAGNPAAPLGTGGISLAPIQMAREDRALAGSAGCRDPGRPSGDARADQAGQRRSPRCFESERYGI